MTWKAEHNALVCKYVWPSTLPRMEEEMGNFVSNGEAATQYGMRGVIPNCPTVPDYDKHAGDIFQVNSLDREIQMAGDFFNRYRHLKGVRISQGFFGHLFEFVRCQ